MKSWYCTIALFILFTACQKTKMNSEPLKQTFRDTLSSQIEDEIEHVQDSIWRNDTSELNMALVMHGILDPLKKERLPDRLDTLEMKLDSISAKYRNLYNHDSLPISPKYEIISTITNEQFHKKLFYSTICEILGFDKATVYRIETPVITDSLIIKKFTLGCMKGDGISDGTIEVCFTSDSIFINAQSK